jgi:hypothetical protein
MRRSPRNGSPAVSSLDRVSIRLIKAQLAPFARTHKGVFILDGPAVESSARQGDVDLDVYCVFPAEQMKEALKSARVVLRNFAGLNVAFHQQKEISNALLSFLGPRAIVIGERRLVTR